MSKRKIIFVIESFILGGAERVLLEIANHLDSQMFDITVCSIFKKSVYQNYQVSFDKPFKPHVHYKWLVNNEIKWLYYIFNYFVVRFPSLMYKLLIGDKYDVVVAFYEGAPTAFVGQAVLKRGKKIAWLHTSTDLSQKNKSSKKLQRQEEYYNHFSKIIAVSKGVKESFTSLFPSQSYKVEIVNNPIDTSRIIEKSKESISIAKPSCLLLVSVGRMSPAKGYGRYLSTIKRLKEEGYTFEVWIIGGGDRTEYESFCQEHLLTNVHFMGNQDNPYPFIKMADWVIIPSLIEGLSTVANESLILNKAVLMTNCPGVEELLGDNEYGIVVNNDEQSIYQGLKTILSNASLKKNTKKLPPPLIIN